MNNRSKQFDFEYKFMSLIIFLTLVILPSASTAYSYLYNGGSGYLMAAGFCTSLLVSAYWVAGLDENFNENPLNIYILHAIGIILLSSIFINSVAAFLQNFS